MLTYCGEQSGARRLHHLKALLEAVGAPVVRVRHVEVGALGARVVGAQEPYLRRVLLGRGQPAQRPEVAGVEGDDQVQAGEPGDVELPGRVVQLVAVPLQDGEGARIGALPSCQPPVPALSTATRSSRPASATRARKTASAIGERQMLPVQTKQTR